MRNRLLTFGVHVQFRIGKPELPVIKMSTDLSELIGPQSWLLLKVAEIPEGEVQSGYRDFVRKIACANDCAKCNICLI